MTVENRLSAPKRRTGAEVQRSPLKMDVRADEPTRCRLKFPEDLVNEEASTPFLHGSYGVAGGY
jgi:hypothetical protein